MYDLMRPTSNDSRIRRSLEGALRAAEVSDPAAAAAALIEHFEKSNTSTLGVSYTREAMLVHGRAVSPELFGRTLAERALGREPAWALTCKVGLLNNRPEVPAAKVPAARKRAIVEANGKSPIAGVLGEATEDWPTSVEKAIDGLEAAASEVMAAKEELRAAVVSQDRAATLAGVKKLRAALSRQLAFNDAMHRMVGSVAPMMDLGCW